jgi:hypothetical protein
MEITGYKLKEALKMASLEKETVLTQFDETLYAFKGEKKPSPEEISDRVSYLETKIATLQTAQSQYNLNIMVSVQGEEMSLQQAIKMVGGAGRLSKMWRSAAKGSKRDRWERQSSVTRKTDEEIALPTITKQDTMQRAKEAELFASRLRSAISTGNTNKVDIPWVGESLFD